MEKVGLYFQKHPDGNIPNSSITGIRHWRQKIIHAGNKLFFRFYPARADYSQPRCIRNKISRDCQKTWNERTRKETYRFLLLNNFQDGDYFVTLTFRDEPADLHVIINRKHYFIKKLNALAGKSIKYLGCIESHNADGAQVRPHLHMVISGAEAASIKKAWIYGNSHCIMLYQSHFDKAMEYMCKTFQYSEECQHRYIRSRDLTPPEVEIRKFDTRGRDDADTAELISSDPVSYCDAMFPEYGIINDPEIFISEYLPGFYLKIELLKKKKKRKRKKQRSSA